MKDLNLGIIKKHLKPLFILLAFLICMIALGGCTQPTATIDTLDEPLIAVAIPPMETFVQEVCGDLAQTMTMVPINESPANYEPTALQKEQFDKAKIYFSIGVSTEIINILPYVSADTQVVDLASRVAEVYPDLNIGDSRDPHIWLSPLRVVVMVEAIAEEMIAIDPANEEIYLANAADYIQELEALDEKLNQIFQEAEQKAFIVFHPSFGYLADDYDLQMYTIEENGKESTAKHLQEMLDLAIEEGLTTIFYQVEIDSSQTRAFAEAIEGEDVILNPLDQNYIENMETMALAISETKNDESNTLDQ